MVLGHGDAAARSDGTAYSWYLPGLRGWSCNRAAARGDACRGEGGAGASRESRRTPRRIDAWYPGIARSAPMLVDAGTIVAIGRTDVDDAASGLHDRTRIGVSSHDGYHSVNTGKLTTAPMFAVTVADRVQAFEAARAG
jgi:hypothetical protein